MSISDTNKTELVGAFRSISLSDLSQRAAMLERLDRKYIVDSDMLSRLLKGTSESFSALEIAGARTFSYRTVYYDSSDRQSYRDHHQGRRLRSKVRLRHYVDTGATFAEIKLKDRRGMTVKSRLELSTNDVYALTNEAEEFIKNTYRSQYRREFPHALLPTVKIDYDRTTLVADIGGERLTIDSQLRFAEGETAIDVGSDLFIVETKSANGNGLADRILRTLHQHPVQHCSKFCVATALLDRSLKNNRFRPVLRRFGSHV